MFKTTWCVCVCKYVKYCDATSIVHIHAAATTTTTVVSDRWTVLRRYKLNLIDTLME